MTADAVHGGGGSEPAGERLPDEPDDGQDPRITANFAYSRYQDKLSGDRADLNTLIGLEDNNYNRWLADRNYLYQLARDQVGDQQTADALAYQKQRGQAEL